MSNNSEHSVNIRPAKPEEANALTALAFESKASWSYSPKQLEKWRGGLTISPVMMFADYVYVAEIDKKIIGYFKLIPNEREWELDHLFVLPQFMKHGIGQALLKAAINMAKQNGAKAIKIDSDPNSEQFYLSCGAKRVGKVAAPIDTDAKRIRPQLLLRL